MSAFGMSPTYVPQYQIGGGSQSLAPQASAGNMFQDQMGAQKSQGPAMAGMLGQQKMFQDQGNINPWNQLPGLQSDFSNYNLNPNLMKQEGYMSLGAWTKRRDPNTVYGAMGAEENYQPFNYAEFSRFNQQMPTMNGVGGNSTFSQIQGQYADYLNNLNAYRQNVLPGQIDNVRNWTQHDNRTGASALPAYIQQISDQQMNTAQTGFNDIYNQYGKSGAFGLGFVPGSY